MIERIHLEIVKRLNQYGTLTKAAKSMNLSQSALSHSITKLEEQLECSIWRKKGRNLSLTIQGEALLNLSKKAIPLFDNVEAQLKNTDHELAGYLRIGMECFPCYKWLSRILPNFLQDCPSVDIDLKQKFKFGAVGALFDYDIDLIITPDPYYVPGLIYTSIFDYELVAVMSSDNILAQKKYLSPDDFTETCLITYPIPKDRLDIFTRFLIPSSIVPKERKCFETTEIILHMVAAGRGITVMPDWLFQELRSVEKLTALRLGEKGLKKTNYIGYRSDDQSVSYIRHFIDLSKSIWHTR